VLFASVQVVIFRLPHANIHEAVESSIPPPMFEGATYTTLYNPIIHNIGRDATIFKFDGGERGHC
jgi:hypothetical protein